MPETSETKQPVEAPVNQASAPAPDPDPVAEAQAFLAAINYEIGRSSTAGMVGEMRARVKAALATIDQAANPRKR